MKKCGKRFYIVGITTSGRLDINVPYLLLLLTAHLHLVLRSRTLQGASTVMATVSQVDVLDQVFAGLRSKSGEIRLASALELQHYVCTLRLCEMVWQY